MPPPDDIQRLLVNIAQSLVAHPESVTVQSIEEGDVTLLRLQVAEGDLGAVIGKQGRTARSIRTILSGISMKTKHHIKLDITEN